MGSVRYAFRFGSWKPTKEEWMLASRCIQKEEKDRIAKFHFANDARAAMCGRLLLRKVIAESEFTDILWQDIKLARTDKGKPYLEDKNSIVDTDLATNFNFNASHQGDYAVVALESSWGCGIDVMKVEMPTVRVEEYFRLMNRQFTPAEWKTIKGAGTGKQQMEMFYRHWCLKESYIKAIGIGLGFDLQRISFKPETLTLSPGTITIDTQLVLDGCLATQWKFQETKLDDEHFVAVALRRPLGKESEPSIVPDFKHLTFSELTSSSQPILPPDEDYWNNFNKKRDKPQRK
ncbi:L-aminoadipate-semialdehyde dehydrogenase-phosphopantetheinyl transferase-like [Anneissia japonica]|uniref:L-aminoadipate-semialdehyde dehydrogenase-phosphopantetheinyl transferase-like n=1 Tax=Anneissia japonica TaxID=1529436 RepID=UPI0014258763|nr:L-aminoadipate-semialdehyde dehydrogenase-phosphopantetheinyl transferase-like [Anneissia japonica]XP_033111872.1 L-aminoadipate-semialdehyde dehydrogenase-phosphopantetheinyl transferase-like [Anneissia japonica]XP_033111873.1 L-aminoadipate-semialdehyde dehydrogenase-phosphopantetheinyl transferase-like [Anneissia japonica]XP_033111874.1 L-aminoadipate-semialdehyde dehydrogenase-phosphopantetheinyl transferase-like [Anneissia japonica]